MTDPSAHSCPSQTQITQFLKSLGFVLVHFAVPPLGQAVTHFSNWLQQGYHGGMAYLERGQAARLYPEQLLPKLASIVVLGFPYDTGIANTHASHQGNVSCYAWGGDYHEILGNKLEAFQGWFAKNFPGRHCYTSVDAQPVLEKAWATKAGLGWLGKHTNVIHPQKGSYFFLSSILTDVVFVPDPIQSDHCGTCTSCIDICPTQAIVAPYLLDARRCISYLTIEYKGVIPRELRPLMGNHIFGCDDCQEVCPWNRFSQVTPAQEFFPQENFHQQELSGWLQLTPEEFRKRFRHTPLWRPKWKGMMRNILVAVGNSGRSDWADLVKEKLNSEEPLVRAHAVWAYHQLLGEAALAVLNEMQIKEKEDIVLEELAAVLL